MNRIPDLEERIIFEDELLLVVDKPHDIPTAGFSLEDEDGVQFWVIKRQGSMVWAVHQLDADTTGVNLFVKEKRLVRVYMDQLNHPDSSKRYLAIVHGMPSWDEVEERSPIGRIDSRNLGVCPGGRPAQSRFRVLDQNQGFSLIEARIFTGRTHQIRIHLSHLSCPLVGEEWYRQSPCKLHTRQALHAWQLSLQSGRRFESPPPQDFVDLAGQLGLALPLC